LGVPIAIGITRHKVTPFGLFAHTHAGLMLLAGIPARSVQAVA